MLIRCPKCGVPSDLDPADVRSGEVVVHCDVCGTRWNPMDGGTAPAVRLHEAGPMQVFDSREASDGLIIEHVAAGFARKVPPHRRAQPKPVKKKQTDRRHLKAAGAILGAFVLAAVVGGPLISAVPGVASMSGIPDRSDFLSFRNVKSHMTLRDGTNTLFVEGEVVNRAPTAVPLPAIRVTLRSPDGGSSNAWLVEPATHEVAAGGAVGFRSVFAAPANGATQVTVSLVAREKQIVGMR